MLSSSSIACLLVTALIGQNVLGHLYDTPIDTEYGVVEGFKCFNQTVSQKFFNQSDSHVAAFLGIPYAADTAHENRWKPAQPRPKWNGTFNATEFGPSCPIARQVAAGYKIGEDCLRVNIWTPAVEGGSRLPVLVWNYGSGETSTDPLYDGGGLATKGIVVVSYNYRDAAFGFLAHPELLEESGNRTTGNYGIQDFFTCLEWIKKNIANFGGDPDRVVIAGQSFGSAQVYHAVNSPLATDLFHGMIAESGIRYPTDPLLAGLADSYHNMSRALQIGLNYTSFHNVSSISELRKLSMDSLLQGSDDRDYAIGSLVAHWTSYPPLFKTTLDGFVVPSTYEESLRRGPPNDVPMITGNTRDESGAEVGTSYSFAEIQRTTRRWYGNLTAEYRRLYPASNETEANVSWDRAATDLSLVSSYLFANGWIKSPATSPFYTYYWDYAPPGQNAGAYHMAEINYVLRNLYATDKPWGEYDFHLADVMSSYWANFVKTLDPNQGGSYENGRLHPWIPNKLDERTVIHLGNYFEMIPLEQDDKVDFMAKWLHRQQPY